MALPTADLVLDRGGWDLRYARVLAVGGDESFAVALVDTDGDGGSIEQCLFLREEGGGWRECSTSGFASEGSGTATSHEHGGHVYAFGREDRPGPVTTTVSGYELHAEANDEGWWVAVRPLPDGG